MKVHFIKDSDTILAYFIDTQRFFAVNEATKSLITSIMNKENKESILNRFNLSLDEYTGIERKLIDYSTPVKTQEVNTVSKERVLGKLVLNIANICNLRCKYCYANGGSYHSDEDLMTMEMAERSLNKFYSFFDKINVVQIFGGEPTMNMPVVKYICEYIAGKDKELGMKTKIGLVTNGTIVTDEFIGLVKTYDIQVTVSYDGDPKVNDLMRVYASGKGTSDVILNNIKRLKEETGQPTTIEVTFNQNHINNGVGIIDIIKFINNTVGNIPLHIVPAGGDTNCYYVLNNRDEFIKSVDDVFTNSQGTDVYTYSLVQRIVTALMTKKSSKYICEAGVGTLSVSIKGDIYPCFMFTDDSSVNLGNIADENVFQSDTLIKGLKRFTAFNKEENEECKQCFIRKSCNGCLGINFLETGNIFTLSEVSCEMFRKMTERVILNLYKLKQQKKDSEVYENAG